MNDSLIHVMPVIHIEIDHILLPAVGLLSGTIRLITIAKDRIGTIGITTLEGDRLAEFKMGFCFAGRGFGLA